MSEHTPGPWVWRWKNGSLYQVGHGRPYGEPVMHPVYEYDTGLDVEISEADAALIAAAPDLFAALQGILTAYKAGYSLESAIDLASEAIAKATGTAP